MSAADAVFVGRLGTAPLAAVGLATVAVWLVLALPLGLNRGARVATSQAVGAGRKGVVLAYGWQVLWASLAMGAVVACLSGIGPFLFPLLGATDAVAAEADTYFRIRALGAPLMLMGWGLTGWFEARGDTRSPIRVNVVANGLNIVLDAVLVTGAGPVPAFGMAGAAWATVASQGVAAVSLVAFAMPELRTVSARLRRPLLGTAWRLGLPMGTERLLDTLVWTAFSAALAVAGDAHLAAHVLAIRVILMSFLPGLAIGESVGVLVGQAVGARRPERAREAWASGVQLSMGLMAVGGLMFVLFPDALIGIFGAEPEVVPIARQLLFIAAAFQMLDAMATTTFLALNGAGDTRFTMLAILCLSWGIKLPLGVGFAVGLGWGAPGAWLGLTTEITCFLLVVLWRWRSGGWYAGSEAPEARAAVAK